MKNDKFYIDGYRYALDNAKSLLEVAVSASKIENYGVGTSLCILSAEESIKAVFIMQQSVKPYEKISDFEKIFRSHKVKHEYLEEYIKQMDRFRIGILEEYGKVAKDRNLRRRVARKNPRLIEVVNWAIQNFKSVPEMLDSFNWFQIANDQKNNGFYLGLHNGEWKIPSKISSSEFDKAFKNAKDIYEYTIFNEKILTNPTFIKKQRSH